MKKRILPLLLVLFALSALTACEPEENPPITTEAPQKSEFVIENGILISYSGNESEVTVPEGVTAISAGAFDGNSSIKVLILPATLTTVEEGCFDNCEALEEVRVADGGALGSSEGLVLSADGKSIVYVNADEVSGNLIIPEGVEFLGGLAEKLNGIKSITLPSTVKEIPDGLFEGSSTLERISLGGVTKIGDRAFRHCTSLSHVDFTNVKNIGEEAFMLCDKLTEIVLPKTRSIFPKCFFKSGVNRIEFGEDLLYIYENAFEGCNIKELTLPAGLRQVSGFAFTGCPIERVTYLGHRGQWLGNAENFYGLLHNITNYELLILGEDPVSLDLNFIPNGDGTCTAHPVSQLEHSGNIIIPEISPAGDRVTGIGSFEGCVSIGTVTLPAAITSIPDRAFAGCVSLRSAVMPGVATIGEGAFEMCTALEKVEYSTALTVIPVRAFYGCSALADFNFHEGITYIGDEAFNSTGLVSVTFPSTVEFIGARAYGGMLTLIRADLSRTSIKKLTESFHACQGLREVILPETLEEIGHLTFSLCTALKTVKLPDGLKVLGEDSFSYSGLESIEIPDSVTTIAYAFSHTEHLKSFELGKGIKEIEGLWHMYGLETFVIPEGFTEIKPHTFASCRNLREIVIPESITVIGEKAFADCTSLVNVTLPKGISALAKETFSECTALKSVTANGVTAVDDKCFFGCKAMESFISEAGLRKIGESAFESCYELCRIDMASKGGKGIGTRAFFSCKKLEEIRLPSGITVLEDSAFEWCTGLKRITLPDTLKEIKENCFYKCDMLENIVLPASMQVIGRYAFRYCASLKTLALNQGLETINEHAFEDCSALAGSITLPASLKWLGDNAFGQCKSLEELTVLCSEAYLGNSAFTQCSSLKTVTLEEMTKLTLGAGLFTNCTSLQKFSVKKGNIIAAWGMFGDCSSLSDIDFSIITVIDGFAFSGCTSLPAEIVINSAVTELGKSAFAGCTSLEKLILPQGLRYIHQEGLKNCISLGELTIGKQTTLYANATNGCTSLKKVFYHGSEKDFKENTEIWEGNEPFTAAEPIFIK